MIGSAVSRLSQRLDEDEKIAQAAGPLTNWDVGEYGDLMQRTSPTHGYEMIPPHVVHGQTGTWAVRHMVRHDPARVLNEVEVGRRIIELWREARGNYERMADARARSMSPTKPEPSDLEKRWMDQADAYEKVIELLVTPQAVPS